MNTIQLAFRAGDEFDQLNDRDIINGEFLRVQWPDGTNEKVKVCLVKEEMPFREMGHDSSYSRYSAFFTLDYHGRMVHLPLRGMSAERV